MIVPTRWELVITADASVVRGADAELTVTSEVTTDEEVITWPSD